MALSITIASKSLILSPIYSSKSVKRAVVEQNGQLIIMQGGDETIKFPLITDGQVQNDILEVIGKDEQWLQAELENRVSLRLAMYS